MKYAVVKTGGKQYRVSEGDTLAVERLAIKPSEELLVDEVLLYVNDDDVRIGNPTVTDVVVKATVMDHIRGEKIRVAKFKSKVRYRRVTGHRQALSQLRVDAIGTKEKTATKK